MKLIEIWKRIGKQSLSIIGQKDAIAFVNGEEYEITGIRYNNGRFVGFETKSKNQWYPKEIKPEIHRFVIVRDKNGKQYNDHQWVGHAWYAFVRDKQGCDGWRSNVEIVEWRYQE